MAIAQKSNVAGVASSTGANSRRIEVPGTITVRDLAELMKVSAIEIIKVLMSNGIMANINQQIDFDTVSIIGEEMGYEIVPPRLKRPKKRLKCMNSSITGS
jgi:hypothetical protein